jgi:TolB-like protein
MHDIFVSYAREDRSRVRPLVEAFEKKGWSVWWDERIRVGTKYARQLDEALNESRCVVVCWSRHALDSHYVQSEAHRSEARQILVPVRLERDLNLPGPFDEYDCADLARWPEDQSGQLEFEKLLKDIEGRLALASTAVPVDTSSYVPGFRGQPAVAVLPLANKTGKPGLDYAIDAITEDIIDRLQRFRSIPVISSHTTMQLKDAAIRLDDVARRLGVQYIVTGSIRSFGSQNRIRVELAKVPECETIWSTHEDVDSFEDSSFPEDLTLRIAAQLPTEIERLERKLGLPIRSSRAPTWHLVRQGIWHQYKLTREGARCAKELFDQALERDPQSAEALVQLSWWHFWDISSRRGEPSEWSKPEALARRTLSIDPLDCRPITLIGISQMMRGHLAVAREYYREAIRLNPSYAWAYAHLGTSLYLDGDPEASLVYTTKAIRLSPLDFFVFHAYCDMATSNYMLKNYSSALDAVNYSLSLRPGYWLAHVIKVRTLVSMGRQQEATTALAEMRAKKPQVSRRDIDWVMFSDRRWNNDLAEGLRTVGMELA